MSSSSCLVNLPLTLLDFTLTTVVESPLESDHGRRRVNDDSPSAHSHSNQHDDLLLLEEEDELSASDGSQASDSDNDEDDNDKDNDHDNDDIDDIYRQLKEISIGGKEASLDEEDEELEHSRRATGNTSQRILVMCTAPPVQQQPLALWRCALESDAEHKERTHANAQGTPWILQAIQTRLQNQKYTALVILVSGGHFAAAIFDGDALKQTTQAVYKAAEKHRRKHATASDNADIPPMPIQRMVAQKTIKAIKHKTMHRYVVRQGQGGIQSAKDGTGKNISSAGSNLRRFNEAELKKGIHALLKKEWADDVATVDRIFYAAGPTGRGWLFGSDAEPGALSRHDARLCKIPFSTKRPGLAELTRVFFELHTADAFAGAALESARIAKEQQAAATAARLEQQQRQREDAANRASQENATPEAEESKGLSKKEKERARKARAKEAKKAAAAASVEASAAQAPSSHPVPVAASKEIEQGDSLADRLKAMRAAKDADAKKKEKEKDASARAERERRAVAAERRLGL